MELGFIIGVLTTVAFGIVIAAAFFQIRKRVKSEGERVAEQIIGGLMARGLSRLKRIQALAFLAQQYRIESLQDETILDYKTKTFPKLIKELVERWELIRHDPRLRERLGDLVQKKVQIQNTQVALNTFVQSTELRRDANSELWIAYYEVLVGRENISADHLNPFFNEYVKRNDTVDKKQLQVEDLIAGHVTRFSTDELIDMYDNISQEHVRRKIVQQIAGALPVDNLGLFRGACVIVGPYYMDEEIRHAVAFSAESISARNAAAAVELIMYAVEKQDETGERLKGYIDLVKALLSVLREKTLPDTARNSLLYAMEVSSHRESKKMVREVLESRPPERAIPEPVEV